MLLLYSNTNGKRETEIERVQERGRETVIERVQERGREGESERDTVREGSERVSE